MIDPLGRFFDSTTGRHCYSQAILAVGIDAAWDEVTFDRDRFAERGGNA
jgi:radical S-adenosyl methionine domain-containing protein 2